MGMRAALLIDYRTKAAQVADYLRCVLRDGGGHRAEALDQVLAELDPDQLERLAERAKAAAAAR
jgi:hypothetical protein